MNPANHKKLLSGKRLHFGGDEPEEERLIKAEWLGKAVRKGVRIDVRKAVIRGELSLQYVTFEEEVSLINCQIEERADFSYTTFNRNLLLSGTTFHRGATFASASMEYSAWLDGAKFLAGEAIFVDLHVHGVFAADGAHFSNGVAANFNRARFDKSAFFLNAIFEGQADFTSAQIGSVAIFTGARFNSKDKLVSFSGAKIGRNAFFNNSIFEGEASFIGAQIDSHAIFTGARFNSKDKVVSFSGAKIGSEAYFNNSIFEGEASFVGAQIDSVASFTGARFNSKDKVVSFSGARFGGEAYFNNSIFEGEANFIDAQIDSVAIFTGARFNSKDKAATFERAKIDGMAAFKGTSFAGKARFLEVHMGGAACFQGAVFKQKVSFNFAKIDGGAFFRAERDQGVSAAVFKGEADFRAMVIGSSAEFQEAVFKQGISFDGTEIRGSAIFHGVQFSDGSKPTFHGTKFQAGAFFQGAEFWDAVDFGTAQFNGESRFSGVKFSKEAKFDASRFTGLARFGRNPEERHHRGAVFNRVSFEHARFEHDARFDDVVFKGKTSFREASFLAVYFSPNGLAQGKEQFQGTVDLRGCVYERIEVDRKSLLAHLEPYDRQPYTQLEKVFRAVGQDRKADEVYLARRRVEHERLSGIRERLRWFGDLLYGLIANYGVRPYRLIAMSIVLLFLGMVFFSLPEAVSPRDEKNENVLSEPGMLTVLSPWDALGVSLHQFLPVEVPIGSQWVPAAKPVEVQIGFSPWALRFKMPPTGYATFFLRLAGWILVPLGIAALTGLLRRVTP